MNDSTAGKYYNILTEQVPYLLYYYNTLTALNKAPWKLCVSLSYFNAVN